MLWVALYLALNVLPICGGKIIACNGFLKFNIDIDTSLIKVRLFKNGNLKYETECSPLDGLYTLPIYENGNYSIKLDNPQNWNFEPHEYSVFINGIDDACSKEENLNFTFTGYFVDGKIYSFPHSMGPSGVEIHLFAIKDLKSFIMKTLTIDGEYYFPEPILPGHYKLSAYHPSCNFSENDITVMLTPEGKIEKMDDKEIIIAGYTIEGRVTSRKGYINEHTNTNPEIVSEAFPTSDVAFYLFQQLKPDQPVLSDLLKLGHISCGTNVAADLAASGLSSNEESKVINDIANSGNGAYKLSFLGQCTSDVEGNFAFHNVPLGDYRIVPHYQNKDVKFEVSPAFADVTVVAQDINLAHQRQLSFEILGFSVRGHVKQKNGGGGLANVNVTLGQYSALSDGEGNYVLESMRTGHYNLMAFKEHYTFKEVDTFVSPNTPKLPDLIPIMYDVCGLFINDNPQASSAATELNYDLIKVRFVPQDSTKDGKDHFERHLDKPAGSFCIPLPSGVYKLQVIVPSTEKFTGVNFFLQTTPYITVSNEPLFGVTFTRYFTEISGEIVLLSKGTKGCPIKLENGYKFQIYKSHATPTTKSVLGDDTWQKIALVKPKLVDAIASNGVADEDSNPALHPTTQTCKLGFKYGGALPGTLYKVCVVELEGIPSCWTDQGCHQIQTATGPKKESAATYLTFVQSGFRINLSTSILPLSILIGKTGENTPELPAGQTGSRGVPDCGTLLGSVYNLMFETGVVECRLNSPSTSICLPDYGSYLIQPLSCYLFESNLPLAQGLAQGTGSRFNLEISEKTAKGLTLGNVILKSHRYVLTVGISSLPPHVIDSHNENLGDSKAKICVYGSTTQASKTSNAATPNGALIGCHEYNLVSRDISAVGDAFYFPNQTFEIDFGEWPWLNVTITCQDYLFRQQHIPFSYGKDFSCSNANTIFEMVPSLFIRGSVHPAEPKVKIDLVPVDGGHVIKTTQTDEAGQYTFGPLLNDTSYRTRASKDGFFLNQMSGGDPFSFEISKISKLQIKVVLEDDSTKEAKEGQVEKVGVPNALISISGGQNFRSLNVTGPDGTISYYGLSPGQYFIRPIMKEYNFTPPSIVVGVESGSSQSIDIAAVKAAFSVRGIVTSMNGLPLATDRADSQGATPQAIVVEARGLAGCELLEEEGTPSPLSGHFEVRALVPGCGYEIRVKSVVGGGGATAPRYRSFPSRYSLSVPSDQRSDLTDFYRFRLMPLAPATRVFGKVSIFTSPASGQAPNIPGYQLLEFFKVSLYPSTPVLDQVPLQSKVLTTRSEFFAFDPVTLNSDKYVVKLESTSALDGKLYDPHVSFKAFTANTGSVFVPFELKLAEKKRVLIEEDGNKGRKESILFFVLIMGLAIMVYGYEKVLFILTSVLQQVIPTLEYILKKSSSLKTSNHSINNFDSSSSVESLSPSTSQASFLNYATLKKKSKVKKS